jgi:hypothetical protein
MRLRWLALVLGLVYCSSTAQSYSQQTDSSPREENSQPHVKQTAPVAAPALLRALNENGNRIGESYAIPVEGGYVTLRGLLAGASRAEIVEGDRVHPVTAVLGDDVERNLVVVSTGQSPANPIPHEALPVTEPTQWTLHCGPQGAIVVKEMLVRDLPSFGIVYVGRTAHGDSIAGCPAWNANGVWSAIVVWESPLARPSVAMVPSAYAAALASQTARPWATWLDAQAQDGARFRNSLIAEALPDIWRAQYSSAIDSLNLLLEKRPSDARAHYYRGYSKAMSGDRQGAIEDYEQAVSLHPTYADAHFSLGFSYLLLKRKLEAMEQAKELDLLDEGMAMKLRMLIDAMSEPSPHRTQQQPDLDDSTTPAETAPNPEP